MRWHVLRTLINKELCRLLANRGGLVMMVLLLVAAGLARFLEGSPVGFLNLAHGCIVDYWREDAWIHHLKNEVPLTLQGRIHFRSIESLPQRDEILTYPQGHGAIQLRLVPENGKNKVLVWVWYPGSDATAMAVFESWFWQETVNFVLKAENRKEIPSFLPGKCSSLIGGGDFRLALATGLILFAVFLINVYLMPSLQAEEREKGLLLVQMLSPATVSEILSAKLVFFLSCSLILGCVLAGLARPIVLGDLFFWLSLFTAGLGSWGVGMTIASLAHSQRGAGMGAMSYLFSVTCLLAMMRQAGIPEIAKFFVEYHYPQLLHAALNNSVQGVQWYNLLMAAGLSLAWCSAGTFFFRKSGWR